MLRKYVLLIVLSMLLGSCAGYTPPVITPERYPDSYATRDVDLHWRVERQPDVLKVTGVVRNKFVYPLLDLDLTARLVDREGKSIGHDAFHAFPGQVFPNQRDEFDFAFPLKPGDAPAKIKYSLRYHIVDDRQTDAPYLYTHDADIR